MLIDILLVEDNPDDVDITLRALSSTKLANRVAVVTDGEEAMEYLLKQGRFTNVPTPSLILLDLNMPKMDGREVLEQIKANETLKTIPIAVLTTSSAEEDVLQSYRLHANCFISKPVTMAEFQKVVRAIDDFWFAVVKLPPPPR